MDLNKGFKKDIEVEEHIRKSLESSITNLDENLHQVFKTFKNYNSSNAGWKKELINNLKDLNSEFKILRNFRPIQPTPSELFRGTTQLISRLEKEKIENVENIGKYIQVILDKSKELLQKLIYVKKIADQAENLHKKLLGITI